MFQRRLENPNNKVSREGCLEKKKHTASNETP